MVKSPRRLPVASNRLFVANRLIGFGRTNVGKLRRRNVDKEKDLGTYVICFLLPETDFKIQTGE